jgi:hypothetical protein
MGARDNDTRLQILERRIAAIENVVGGLPSVAADPGKTTSVFATYAGALGDSVKLSGGSWSALIDTDVVTGPVGVVVAISSTWAEIAILGTRIADGTPGTTYYAPAAAGPPVTPAPTEDDTHFAIAIERQITPTLRLIGGMGGGGGGGGSGSITVVVPAFFGVVSAPMKCEAGTWSYLTNSDSGAFLVGITLAVDDGDGGSGDTTVLVYGTGVTGDVGTPGTVFYAPPTAGPMTSTRPTPQVVPTESMWERVVAVQLTEDLIQVLQIPAFRVQIYDDCQEPPAQHAVPEMLT